MAHSQITRQSQTADAILGRDFMKRSPTPLRGSLLERSVGSRRHLKSRPPHETTIDITNILGVWFAKTLADFEINDIAALPPLLCYNSYLCFDSSACASERWFVCCARVGASYSRIWRYVNNSPS